MPQYATAAPPESYLYRIPINIASAGQTYLAANATVTLNYQVVNFPFRWLLAVAASTGLFKTQIYDQGRTYYLSPAQIRSDCEWGTAQQPMPLLTPYTFQQNTQVQFTVTDLSGANNTIQLVLIGYQIVPAGTYGAQY